MRRLINWIYGLLIVALFFICIALVQLLEMVP